MNRVFFLAILLLFPALTLGEPVDQFENVTPGRILHFPRDHGAHPSYKTEWWYFTGHLLSKEKTFGFELTFFRVGIRPRREGRSAWESPSVYLAHFAVTDDANNSFVFVDRSSRGAFNEATASLETLDVSLKNWSAKFVGEQIVLNATEPNQALSLTLTPSKKLIYQGENGFSQKGAATGDASYYTSFTRLNGTGSLSVGGRTYTIDQADAWMDHEFSSSPSTREQIGWDWFALQLSNNTELMVYQLRGADGRPSRFASGTFVDQSGETTELKPEDFTIRVKETWKSPKTKILYPSGWEISVPSKNLSLVLTPTVKDQELRTESSTNVTYWEGRNTVTGKVGLENLTGNAYVELVGYRPE